MEEREREATLVETQALSVSHSKFSFPTSVLPRPPSVSASPSLIPRLDLQVQTSTMKFLHELFLRDRRPSFNMADPGPGSVRANLADQTEAKSHAFVRVNSIHCLSLSLSLSHSCNNASSLSNALYISLSLFFPAPYPLHRCRSLPLSPPPPPFFFPLPLTCTPPPCFLPHHPRERPFQSMSSRQRSFRQSFSEGRARQRLSRGGARGEGEESDRSPDGDSLETSRSSSFSSSGFTPERIPFRL